MVSQRTVNSFHPGVACVKTSYGCEPQYGVRDGQCDYEYSEGFCTFEMSQMT